MIIENKWGLLNKILFQNNSIFDVFIFDILNIVIVGIVRVKLNFRKIFQAIKNILYAS